MFHVPYSGEPPSPCARLVSRTRQRITSRTRLIRIRQDARVSNPDRSNILPGYDHALPTIRDFAYEITRHILKTKEKSTGRRTRFPVNGLISTLEMFEASSSKSRTRVSLPFLDSELRLTLELILNT